MKTRTFIAAILWLAMACCQALGQDNPIASITGPDSGEPGDIIQLDSSDAKALFRLWIVDPPTFPDGKPTYRESRDSTSCQVASRPGVYKVILVVSNDQGIDAAWHMVTVSPSGSKPPAGPPDPVSPPPKDIRDWVRENAPKDAAVSKKFADLYRSWASGGRSVQTVSQFAGAQQALNKMLLKQIEDDGTWDTFLGGLAQELASMRLETVRQHVEVWTKIASGLESVGQ